MIVYWECQHLKVIPSPNYAFLATSHSRKTEEEVKKQKQANAYYTKSDLLNRFQKPWEATVEILN